MKVSKRCKECIAKDICSLGIDTKDKQCIKFHKLLGDFKELENYEPCPNCGERCSTYSLGYACSSCHYER